MPVSKKTPANAGKPSQQKPASKAASTKGVQQKPAPKAVPVKSDAALKLPQAPAAAMAKKTAASETKISKVKDSKKQEKPAQQAKADPAPPSKNKAKGAKEKPKKAKLVRDSFTMPGDEYEVIGDIKKACIGAGFAIKKSELLRIGVALLKKMTPSQIQASLAALPTIKAGRPKKN